MIKLPSEIDVLFNGDQIRRVQLGEQWLYSAVDLVQAMGDQPDPKEYWEDLKRWEPQLAAMSKKVKLPARDGTWSELEMLTMEQAFRLLESISSPKAERAKLWLAESGRQRVQELADPELAIAWTRKLYQQKGFSRDWVEKRIRGIGARHELTSQWYRRGAQASEAFRTLSNELSQGVFGMDVACYRRYKGLRNENLRDHMDELELALTVLGETTAAMLHKSRDAQGLDQLLQDVRDAGQIAGQTRQAIEGKLGRAIVSSKNNLRPLFGPRRTHDFQAANP